MEFRLPALADAAYGDNYDFREGITELGLRYMVGIRERTTIWEPGESPLPPKQQKGKGRPGTRARLRRTQARTGTGTLRRSRLARISSSCHLMHRRLWLPRYGKKSFFPHCTRRSTGATHRETSVRVQTPRLPAPAPNVIIPIRSQQYAFSSPGIFSSDSLAAPFALHGAADYL
jgi:DDE superfamily endonuclease